MAVHYPKPKKVGANVLTPAEVEDYLDAAEWLDYLPIFLLALTAGLRQGELIVLKYSAATIAGGLFGNILCDAAYWSVPSTAFRTNTAARR